MHDTLQQQVSMREVSRESVIIVVAADCWVLCLLRLLWQGSTLEYHVCWLVVYLYMVLLPVQHAVSGGCWPLLSELLLLPGLLSSLLSAAALPTCPAEQPFSAC